jgi:lysyl-tRNA synthetase class I
LLAQIKPDNEGVWTSLRASHGLETISGPLQDRLKRMRSWIDSEHFPEDMRVVILTAPNREALDSLTEAQREVLPHLHAALQDNPWTSEGINAAFKQAGKQCDLGMRDVYRSCYAVFMGAERGPRLAPIIANCDQTTMLELVDNASGFV